MKRALIAGIAGQDGSYLAEFLLGKGYRVDGVVRPGFETNSRDEDNLAEVKDRIILLQGDLSERKFVRSLVAEKYDEIYNLASVSNLLHPWDDAFGVIQSTGYTPLRFLDALRELSPETAFLQASSSEMFGNASASPQNETTPFSPQKPYAYGKVLAHQAVGGFRRHCGLRASAGILYNHESPRRAKHFLTRKVTSSLARIKLGLQDKMTIGNLDAIRDWGYAPDYTRAMHAILQAETLDDYIIATGLGHTVREFIEIAALALALPLHWEGVGVTERGLDENGKEIVVVAKEFYRPTEEQALVGDSRKLRHERGWQPTVTFEELVAIMVRSDVEKLTKR